MTLMTSAPILLAPQARLSILQDCHAADGKERVGLLFGLGKQIHSYTPLSNHTRCDGRFLVDMEEVLREIRRAAAQGLASVGRFQTQIGGNGRPSAADRSSLLEGWIDVIAQVDGDQSYPALTGLQAFDGKGRSLMLDWDAVSEARGMAAA